MIIAKKQSLLVAEKVVKAFKKIAKKKDIRIQIQSYQNGREQGLSLHNYTSAKGHVDNFGRCVMISEGRSSDYIMLYPHRFDPMQSISELAYENSANFFPGDYDGAAQELLTMLTCSSDEFKGMYEKEKSRRKQA